MAYDGSANRVPDGTFQVVPYDPEWPTRFEQERRLLEVALPAAIAIDHVGSTSVPGLSAKPTIDVLVVMTRAADALRRTEHLAAAGFDCKPGSFVNSRDHVFLRKVEDGKRVCHVHVLDHDARGVEEYRLFRDFLIAYLDVAARYEEAKLRLERDCKTRMEYVEGKEPIVDALMLEARERRC